MEDSSCSEISDLPFNEESIKIDENKETEAETQTETEISNLEEHENLIRSVKEKQKELSDVLNEIDKIKDEYKKLYNEKEMMKEYIGNSMEINNKTTKK
ncbi:hypothetical protein T552_03283 [Pneumocystis carinii B80]|uniref:Uncharacterized protein n=1 Tax=Pneumocystis carinii (strain B80) TaxID=1408658 RepID=A0A0W4ZCA5_PNEC8|nr:hypothetical protein T552_03283 [Pneumocystis carinii B80]KTW26013.1 hypothetical protein T552_03283 [Pneumocystis carinii B80]